MGSIYFYYIVATAACLVCASTSSAQTPAQPAEPDVAAEELSKDASREKIVETLAEYRGRLSQLESLVTYLLGQRNDGNHAPLELPRQPATGNGLNLIERLVRRSREAPSGGARPPAALTNDSEHAYDDDDDSRSRTLHGSHWITTDGGTVYTHWGRPDCRNGSELVYTGTTAGSYYSHTGGGSNILCMPMEPIYDQTESSAHASRGLLYSSEFETSTAPAFSELHDTTPACAVCRAPANRLTQLMIPARNECPSSKWRLEYRGYLMSSVYTGKRSEFICVDREAKAVPGTTGSQSGALFYMVEGRCLSGGGMDCGPYVNGYELTCAVCTI